MTLCAIVAIGCDRDERPSSVEPAAPEPRAEGLEDAESEDDGGTLRPALERQFRIADFPEPNEARTILVEVSLKGPRRERPDDLDGTLMNVLKRRAPAPWVLKRRDQLERGERTWARIHIIYRKVIDRFRKRGKAARRGRLKFEAEVLGRFPKGMSSNWDEWRLKADFERPVKQLEKLDSAIVHAIERELGTLAVRDDEAANRFVNDLDFRPKLLAGEFEPVFDEPLFGLFRGGCVGTATEEGIAVYRLHDTTAPVFELGPNEATAVRCAKHGAYSAVATTDRSVDIEFHAWRSDVPGWTARASFPKAIDTSSMRFLASGTSICLVGEHHEVGQRHARVLCYDAGTGKLRWRWDEPGTDLAGIAIRRGELVLAAGRHVRVIDVATGAQVWSGEIPEATGLSENSRSCLVDDVFVFAHSLGRYLAFDVSERSAPWEVTTYGGSSFLYCDNAGRMFIDEVGGEMLAVTMADLAPAWKFRVADRIMDALFHGGFLFVLMPRAIYALDAATGEIAWQLALPFDVDSLYRHNRRLYLVADDALYELTRRDRL